MKIAYAVLCAFAAAVAIGAPQGSAAEPASKPETKGWSAWENRMPGVRIEPGKTTLLIVGEVETAHAGVKPVLKRLGARGDDATALEVELTLEGEGGAAAPEFRTLETLIIVPQNRFKRVIVLHEGAPVSGQPITVRPAY